MGGFGDVGAWRSHLPGRKQVLLFQRIVRDQKKLNRSGDASLMAGNLSPTVPHNGAAEWKRFFWKCGGTGMRAQKETGESDEPAEQGAGNGQESEPGKSTEQGVLDRLIKDFEERLKNNQIKLTVGDYIRLMQLRKELGQEEPKEIKVTWVEPTEKEHANET